MAGRQASAALPAVLPPAATIRFPMPEENDEQFVQKRLLLACVLSAVAIAAYVYVANLTAPPRPPAPQAQESVEEPGSQAASAESPEPAASAPSSTVEPAEGVRAEPAQSKADDTEREIVVETDAFTVSFSNRGGVVTKWVLKDYQNAAGEPLDLVHEEGAKECGKPFGLALPGGEPIAALDNALFTVNRGMAVRRAPATVVFEYSGAWLHRHQNVSFRARGLSARSRDRAAGKRRSALAHAYLERRIRGHGPAQRLPQ